MGHRLYSVCRIQDAATHVLATVRIVVLFLVASTAHAQEPEFLYPNLVPFAPFDIQLVDSPDGTVDLRFSVSTQNLGTGQLELLAGSVERGRQTVAQRLYRTDGSYQDFLAGRFVWHQGHNHFHFEDFAEYVLQSTRGKSKRSSSKTSFCLMDTDLVNGQLPGAPASPFYANCGNSFQGISVGWADTYSYALIGQSLDVTNLKDGDYRLIIESDPKDRLLENNEADNTSCVLLNLSVTSRSVTILDPNGCDDGTPQPGAVTVTGITPNSAAVGETISVTITGTGFSDGIKVSFENGNGSRPVVERNPVIVSDTEIHANVTVQTRGGLKTDNLWDLTVGSATLPDAFTVTP